METQNLCVSKTLNPPLLSRFQSLSLSNFSNPLLKTIPPINPSTKTRKSISIRFSLQNASNRREVRAFAGRSKGKPGGTSTGRIEGNAELRREAKRNARRKSRKLAESLFYRLKNPHKNYPDNFSEEELQMMGLGYDRLVRFMDKDDPNLKHPYDWYKYGEFGPYSWRGVVLGEPGRGGLTDECVTMIGEVRDQEEWEKIEQHEMGIDFQSSLDSMDKQKRIRYFWVFVRHPRWRVSDLPWHQWTLVSEVALEAGDQRLDKWSLMGRLGNTARANITKCAAWMRPDIIYVKRPVYQCRFEPQDEFFRALAPLLDPETEEDFLFELEMDDGRVELCTYFGGLCKIVRVNPKAYVDDVVKAYEKLSDEKKSKCLEFLFSNHPVLLLHPYTKEWKVKLEEMELGCDAPDDDDFARDKHDENRVTDWIEDNGNDVGDNDEDNDQDNIALEVGGSEDDELGMKDDEDESPEEDPRYWDEEFRKALSSNEAMEKLVKRSSEISGKFYEERMREMQEGRNKGLEEGDEQAMRSKWAKVSPAEWEMQGYGPYRRKIKKSKVPPGMFLRAAVRPFTYRNLVKEIVLTRHAIVEGEIGMKK